MECEPTWTARFVEGLLRLAAQGFSDPLIRAIHMYFAAIEGFVELNLLSVWVAAESFAKQGIKANVFPDELERRIANHDEWVSWVRRHQEEIETLAVPGMGSRLVDRVISSENDRPTPVERVFSALKLPWTPEMEDAQKARHEVAHEGTLPGEERDWDRDRARVGLVKTMLTALLGKASRYEGPIADRSRTCFKIAGSDKPKWWQAVQLDNDEVHEGAGVAESTERWLAELRRLESEAQDKSSNGSADRPETPE